VLRTAVATCILAAYFLGYVGPGSVRAQVTDAPQNEAAGATDQARALFQEGAELAKTGSWSAALQRFERSQALLPHPVTAYNLGYSERALGHVTRARRWFKLALGATSTVEVALPDDVAAAARRYETELNALVARRDVSDLPAGAALAVDGRPLDQAGEVDGRPLRVAGLCDPGVPEEVPTAFVLELDPGAHQFRVVYPGVGARELTQDAVAGSRASLSLAPLMPSARTSVSTFAAPRSPASEHAPWSAGSRLDESPRSGLRLAAYSTFGIGAAGILAGVTSGGIALAQRGKLAHDCEDKVCSGHGAGELARARTAADVATVTLSLGAVALATGLVLWLLATKQQRRGRHATGKLPWYGPYSSEISRF
jgi:hypothetical protein